MAQLTTDNSNLPALTRTKVSKSRFPLDFLHSKNYLLFLLGWLPINEICIERRLLLLKKMLDGRAPDSLSEILLSLKYHQSHDTRSRLPYRLHIPRTNSMKRMFLYRAVKQRNNVSDNNSPSIIHGDNDLVHSSDVKKFKRNYFDSVMCKFTPDSFKIDRIF